MGSSQGPADGGRTVGVTGAGQRTVAIAIEWRLVAEGRVRKSERLRTLRVTLHAVRETNKSGTGNVHKQVFMHLKHNLSDKDQEQERERTKQNRNNPEHKTAKLTELTGAEGTGTVQQQTNPRWNKQK